MLPIMSKASNDILFQLIHSLEKAEKRNFKLYIKRNSANDNLKVIQLFDALDKLDSYDEAKLLKKLPAVQKQQLANIKTHLYKQILASLRILKSTESLDLQLNELFDWGHILYKKGLFQQSLKILERAKELARSNQKLTFLTQIIALEKRIESLHITRSLPHRAEELSKEALEVSKHIDLVTRLSNLVLSLYGWYIKKGHTRDEKEEAELTCYFKSHLPQGIGQERGFYERLYLYQSYSWYAFIKKDFLQYYRYAQKWTDLFEEDPSLKRIETGNYIKGLHNLLNAHYDLRNHKQFAVTLKILDDFSHTKRIQENDNFRVQTFLYLAQAKINQHFLKGTFREGLSLVPKIEQKLVDDALFIDQHRIMVLYYKIAGLHFGSGDHDTALEYLNKIIHDDLRLRHDLQVYARLLQLLCHYELGNDTLLEYLAKSLHRLMSKMDNRTQLEEEILRFLRRFFFAGGVDKEELKFFLQRIKPFERNQRQTRVFAYFDIVSWVESKVLHKSLPDIIKQKYNNDLQKRNTTMREHG